MLKFYPLDIPYVWSYWYIFPPDSFPVQLGVVQPNAENNTSLVESLITAVRGNTIILRETIIWENILSIIP